MTALLKNSLTREGWLNDACDHILDNELGPITNGLFKRPNIWVSVGFPKGGRKVIGFCYVKRCSGDGVNEIFVTPAMDKSLLILGVLVHELIHATDNCESGHRGFFRKTALAVGLEGKMTATISGEALTDRLTTYLEKSGPIPHAKISLSNVKKQSTRMIKLECDNCGFIARTARKWSSRLHGSTICPCCENPTLKVEG